MLDAHRTFDGVLLAQQGEIAVLLMPRPPGDASEISKERPKRRRFRMSYQQRQKLTRTPGLCPVRCSHHQAFQSLSDPNASSKPNNNPDNPGFYGEEPVAMVLFSNQRDLELQIKDAKGTLAAVDP